MICPNCRVDKESTLASAKALLKERDELRDRVEQLEADREKLLQLLKSASEVIGRFVSDEGWAQSDMDTLGAEVEDAIHCASETRDMGARLPRAE